MAVAAAPAAGGPSRCCELGVVAPPFPPRPAAAAAAAAAADAAADASAAAVAAAARLAVVPAALATAAASRAALRSAAVCDGGLLGLAGGTALALPSRSSLIKYFWACDRTCKGGESEIKKSLKESGQEMSERENGIRKYAGKGKKKRKRKSDVSKKARKGENQSEEKGRKGKSLLGLWGSRRSRVARCR